MSQQLYNLVTGRGACTAPQYNEWQTRGLATAIQCQKRHHHLNGYLKWFSEFVMVLFLAFLRTMLTFDEYKKSLGKRAESLTDVQIEALRVAMYKIAEGFFDKWNRKNTSVVTPTVRTHRENGNYMGILIFEPLYV